MGWDAFGLPAENAAIKRGLHPRDWTRANIAEMKKTHRRFAFSYDWDREISTCEPEYYHWNQWFFLKMLERGLAYRRQSRVNWCPECGTVLANEQVVDGCCWRHETTPVEQRELEQWFFASPTTPTSCSTTLDGSRAAGPSACSPCSATGSAARKAPKSISTSKAPDSRSAFSRRASTRSTARPA